MFPNFAEYGAPPCLPKEINDKTSKKHPTAVRSSLHRLRARVPNPRNQDGPQVVDSQQPQDAYVMPRQNICHVDISG